MSPGPELGASSQRSGALDLVLSSRLAQEVLARAMGTSQRALRRLQGAETFALHAVGLAARSDYDPIRKQVARLKRKARQITEVLDAAPAHGIEGAGPAPLDAPGSGGGTPSSPA